MKRGRESPLPVKRRAMSSSLHLSNQDALKWNWFCMEMFQVSLSLSDSMVRKKKRTTHNYRHNHYKRKRGDAGIWKEEQLFGRERRSRVFTVWKWVCVEDEKRGKEASRERERERDLRLFHTSDPLLHPATQPTWSPVGHSTTDHLHPVELHSNNDLTVVPNLSHDGQAIQVNHFYPKFQVLSSSTCFDPSFMFVTLTL